MGADDGAVAGLANLAKAKLDMVCASGPGWTGDRGPADLRKNPSGQGGGVCLDDFLLMQDPLQRESSQKSEHALGELGGDQLGVSLKGDQDLPTSPQGFNASRTVHLGKKTGLKHTKFKRERGEG